MLEDLYQVWDYQVLRLEDFKTDFVLRWSAYKCAVNCVNVVFRCVDWMLALFRDLEIYRGNLSEFIQELCFIHNSQ